MPCKTSENWLSVSRHDSAVLVILSIFIPPLAVYLKTKSGKDTVINLALWLLLFGIGGIIHALYVVLKK